MIVASEGTDQYKDGSDELPTDSPVDSRTKSQHSADVLGKPINP